MIHNDSGSGGAKASVTVTSSRITAYSSDGNEYGNGETFQTDIGKTCFFTAMNAYVSVSGDAQMIYDNYDYALYVINGDCEVSHI